MSGYYSERQLNEICLRDVYTLGVLALNQVQPFPKEIHHRNLKKEELENVLKLCQAHYSNFMYTLLSNIVAIDPQKRWTLRRIQKHLNFV